LCWRPLHLSALQKRLSAGVRCRRYQASPDRKPTIFTFGQEALLTKIERELRNHVIGHLEASIASPRLKKILEQMVNANCSSAYRLASCAGTPAEIFVFVVT
jgi:hypothetical protein